MAALAVRSPSAAAATSSSLCSSEHLFSFGTTRAFWFLIFTLVSPFAFCTSCVKPFLESGTRSFDNTDCPCGKIQVTDSPSGFQEYQSCCIPDLLRPTVATISLNQLRSLAGAVHCLLCASCCWTTSFLNPLQHSRLLRSLALACEQQQCSNQALHQDQYR